MLTLLVGWHASAVSLPPSDIILAELACHLNDVIVCLHWDNPGNTKGGSITVPLTPSLTGMDWSVLQIKTKIVGSHTADSKPAKQEVNGTVILSPIVFPD